MQVLIGIQARTASTRLPGKIYEKIGDKTILEWAYQACKRVDALSKANQYAVVILGPEGDHRLENECIRMGAEFRLYPDENDVLNRYRNAAREYRADAVIRVTSDCWNIDTQIINECAKALSEVDYASNCIIRSFEEGQDVQGCSVDALEWIARETTSKEHVFDVFEENAVFRNKFVSDGFTLRHILNQQNIIFRKNSIDTIQDLERARGKQS